MNLNQSFKSIIYLLLTFISSITFGQEVVDLSNWEQRGDLTNGNWVYDNSNNSLRQTTNSDPTFYVSDNKYLNKAVEGSLKVNTTSDDDMVGFVLGFESAVDNLESINKFLLIDWKQGNQNEPGYGAANAEIRLSYFNTTENDNTVFWETQTANDTWGNIDVYKPSNSFDGVNSDGGWVDNFTYRFKAVYTELNVKIYFDFGNGVYTKVFDVDASSVPFFNSFPDGKFGFYNYSQDQVIYDNFTVPNGNLTVVASGGGTEGEDWQRTGTTIIPMSSNAKINASQIETFLNSSDITIVCDGDISVESDITSGSSYNFTLKSKGNISQASGIDITTSGGSVILWANSDDQATNGSIALRNGSSIVTGSGSVPGGNVWIGGGSDGATWNGLAVGLGYAVPGTTFTPSNGGSNTSSGIYLEGSSINSFGGHVKLAADASNLRFGLLTYATNSIDAKSGKIELEGIASNTSATDATGILFGIHDKSIPSIMNLTSSASDVAINITSVGRGIGDAFTLSGTLNALSTGTGEISIKGNAINSGSSFVVGSFYSGTLNAFAASGKITLNGGTKAVQVKAQQQGGQTPGPSKINIGQGGTITNSSSDVFITADNIALAASGIAVNSTGKVTVESSSNSFASALTYPITNLSLANTVSGLTLGKSTNTQNITFGGVTTIAGPITAYGGNIALNANLTSSALNSDILLEASGYISQSANTFVQTNMGNIVYWSDTDANGGYITLADNVTINSANGLTTSGLTGGGIIILAGGIDDGSNGGTASDGMPDGFASSSTGNGIKLGSSTANNSQFYSGGGDILIRGVSSTNSVTNQNNIGVFQLGKFTANAGKGSISINGESANSYGVNFVEPISNVTSGATHLSLISDKASGTAVSIIGSSNASHGVVFNYNNPKEILATGGGAIVITGSGGGSEKGIFLQNQDILATSGSITLNGGAKGIYTANAGMNLGRKAGSAITISSSDISLITDSFSFANTSNLNTSGKVTLESNAISFTSTLTFPITNLTISNDVSGLTLGKATNTQNITFGGVTTIAGPITTYGGTIAVNSNLTTTGNSANTILLKAIGNISQASGIDITTNGADVIYWADSDASGNAATAGGTIALLDASTITSNGGDIILGGGADADTDGIPDGYAIGAYGTETHGAFNATAGISSDNSIINSGVGNVILRGQGTGALQNFQMGTRLYGGSISGKDINIAGIGSINGSSSSSWGLSLEGFSIEGSGNIVLTGKGGQAGLSNSDYNQVGVEIRKADIGDHSQVSATGTGTILINGQGGSGPNANHSNDNSYAAGIRIDVDQTSPIHSVNGNITLNGTSGYSGLGSGMIIGSPITSTDGEVILKGLPSLEGTTNLNGNIEIKGSISTGGGITLESPGEVTQTAAITGENLGVIGTGTFTLTNTNNNVVTLAGGDNTTKLGSLSYTDTDGLTIGSVNPTGVTSSGVVEIAARSGDLLVNEPIISTLATGDAIKLYADKDELSGNLGDGNIKISDNGSISVESGARALLYSGRETESTGVQTEVGGEDNTRTQVDATTDLSTLDPVLATTGKYGLFRMESVNDNANLLSLTTSSGMLSPVFDSATTDYTVVLPKGTTSVNFTPTTDDASATLKINEIAHTSGASYTASGHVSSQEYSIEVTSSDGSTTKTYTLTVYVTQEPSATAVQGNEDDGYLVFDIEGTPQTVIQLTVNDVTANGGGVDYQDAFEVSVNNGTSWTTYSNFIQFPTSGVIKVRVAIIDDNLLEDDETFELSYKLVTSEIAQATIYDVDFEQINLSNPTRTTNVSGDVGDIYKKTNAITIDGQAIDVVIEITDASNVSSYIFDNDGSNSSRFQSEINSSSSQGSYIEYEISFFESGTSNEVYLKGFAVSGVDVDGPEYVELSAFDSYELDESTKMAVTEPREGYYRFTRPDGNSLSGISFENTSSFISYYTSPVQSFTFRKGNTTSNSSRRLFSLTFGDSAGTFSSSVSEDSDHLVSVTGTIIDNDLTPLTSQTITIASIADLVYTGIGQTPSPAVQDGTTVLVVDTDYTLSYVDNINVGTATVTVTGIGNYSGTKDVTFDITLAPLTITSADTTKEFGEVDPSLTVSYAGFVNAEDQEDLTGTLAVSRVAGESVGTYAITASGLTSTNYDITYTPGTFTITSRLITQSAITVSPITDLVYTGLGQTPSPAVQDGATVLVADTDYTLSYVANTNVGTATVTVTGIGDYSGTKQVTFNILKKALTISGLAADDKEYDGTSEATLSGTASLVGLVDGDDIVLSGTSESTFTSPNVSTAITVTVFGYELTGTAKDNYSLSQPTGLSADITYRTISVTPTSGLTKLYGESDPEFTYTFSGTVSGQMAAFSGSLSRIQGENAGSYQKTQGSLILLDNGSFKASNHVISLTAGIDFEITKAPLIVTVNNDAKFVTQADTQGYAGVSYSGFKFGEDATSLNTTNLTITRSNAGVEASGVYTDVLEASGITSQNYAISYQPADYQIVAADQLYVKLADTEVVYGEEPVYLVELSGYYSSDNTQVVDLTSSTSVTGNKVTVVDGASGSAEFLIVPETPLYSTSNHLSVGTYNLVSDQAVFTSSNFNNTLIEQGVLRVNPKELVVSLSSTKSKVYDGNSSLPSMTFDLTTPFTGDKVSAVGTGIYESANAGETDYRVSGLSLSGSDANNYYIQGGADVQITGTDGQISKRTITVVPRVGQSKIFGASDPILTYDYSGEVNGETPLFNGSLERVSGEPRGLYAISQGSLLLTDKDTFLASNYELVFTSGIDFTITNKLLSDQDISILPILDLIYNGQSQEPEVEFKDIDIVLVEGVDYELLYDNNTNVGKATITITGLGNYGGVRTVTFNILPRAITVTPDSNQSKEYGVTDPILTYTVSGEISGETPEFSNNLSRVQGENVGIYQITQGSLILADNGNFKASNYEIDFASNIYFTITKAPLTITVNNDAKFVTQADMQGYAGVSYSGFKFGEDQTAIDTTNLSINRSNLGVEAVGVYPAVLEASGVTSQNYDIVYQKGDYTIIGADQLLVKLKDTEVVYADVPVFEVLEAGYYNSNNTLIEDLTSSVQINGTQVTVTDGTSGTAVFDIVVVSPQLSSSGTLQSGSYELKAGNISKTSPNFSDTIILQGNLNVIPKELTVSLISSVTKVYDGNDNLLNLELALDTPIITDVVLASGAGVYDSKDAGTRNYTVSGITLSGADAENYYIQGGVNAIITGADGVITKRTLTVIPDLNQSKTFGESDPSLTYIYSGLINGETPLFSGALGRNQGEDVGSYQMTQGDLVPQDNGLFLKDNYAITYEAGEFTITSKLISDTDITIASIADLVYTGLGQTPSLEVKDGTTVLVQDTDYTLSYVDNINVGTATVTVTGIGNYSGTKDVTFDITLAPLTITADDNTKEFGEADLDLTVSYAGFVNGEDKDDLTGTLSISRESGESVGSYAITASGLTSTNYALTYTAGEFTITSKSVTDTDITIAPVADIEYNGSLQRPKPIVEDGSNILEEGSDYSLSYSDNTNVGTATVTVTGIGNYSGTRTVTFMIVPKVIAILIPDQEKDYGAQEPVLVFTADPILYGSDVFTGALSRASGEAVGEYLISSGTLSAGDNYILNIQTDAIFRIIRIDSDGDGVADDIEETDGTDPTDTCDFVLASQTVTPSTAWNSADCDSDGVTNADELTDGTDPLNPDSDGDGVIDGTEKTDGTDGLDFCSSIPSNVTLLVSQDYLDADCDDDGLSNGDEIGPDVNNPIDSDNDGIYDYLEYNNHTTPISDDLEVFNLLTPNNDGENDVFVIRNIELYPENTLEIYNRWGVKVYSVSGYGQNGRYFTGESDGRSTVNRSSLLPTGTYFYILRYKPGTGDFKERKGYLYLTR